MKVKKSFLYLLALITSITIVWAGAPSLPALSNVSTGTPESGKKYYIYADTYYGGKYVPRYFYINDNNELKLNVAVDESNNNYVWTCTVTNGKYTFQNAGNTAKYLAHKTVADAAYNFTLGKTAANHKGTTIYSDGASRYFVTKNDGTSFDQATGTYNQASQDYCTDYVFIEYVEPSGNTLEVTANYTFPGTLKVNGEVATFPYKKWQNTAILPATFTVETSNPYKFLGFFAGDQNLGKEYTVTSLADASVAIEARFELDIFSASLDNPVPVQIYSNRNQNYAIKMNAASSYTDKAVNSGISTYGENEIWYLVGDASSFKMYNRTAGKTLALKLAGTGQGSAATLATEGTELCLVKSSDGSYNICPKTATGQSFNMHGGAGNDIKLYDSTDGGSYWLFSKIDATKPLTLNYNASLNGGYEQNYKIGELSINIAGKQSKSMLEKSTVPASSICYLPEDATFSLSTGFICHGWNMDINGSSSISEQTIPAGGTEVNINISVDQENKYQYLYYSPGPNGKPYRIPALATTANGYVFAINDYRPCGNDIGYGEVDLVMRHSTAAGSDWDGHSWTEPVTIADGLGHANEGIWKLGFGDPAIVADRETNEILVMSVCGNRTCWDGNYGAGTADNPENPNRVSRLYIKFNEKTQQWVVGEPEEVTYSIYPLFDDEEGNHHVGSMFIGAGRIAQSSKIKVGTHYRIYCAVWAVSTGSGRYHNYAIYSDDFGKTWNLLGELGNDYNDSPAPYGNEPKCEELPDGSVLLSSRKGYGRYFNVFHYTDIENGKGTWDGVVSTDAVGDLKWGNNDTNGEPLRVGNVLFQSAPTGNGRRDVSIFYKVLSNDPADYTPTKLSNGWTEIEISDEESAYSSMALLPDNETLAIFYEEAPGGYSMVYLPLKLKNILPADVYQALSAIPPTYASENSPVWHHIKFGATGNVLCDQGAGNNAATATAEETDAKMWNIVGTKEQFYLVSKLGNYLAYNKANNRYTTSSNKSDRVALTLKENIKGSWEIMRKGASKSMSEVAKARSAMGEIADATICGESNQIAFNDLTPEIYDPAIYSTEDAPVWFKVQFKAGECFLTDKGDGNKLQTATRNDADTQLWQFIGTPEGFYMKSKAGNYVYFTNSRFTASSTNKTELDLTKNAADGYYEIGQTNTDYNMNQHGGSGAGKEIGQWGAGDTNNPLQIIAPLPYFSTEEEPVYWWINLNTSNAVIEDKGAGANALTASKSYTDKQLWQLVGNEDNFYMKNKAGRYFTYNSEAGRFQTTESADGKTALKLRSLGNNNYEIQLQGVTQGNYTMNPNGGAGAGKELGLWSSGDTNNPVSILTPEQTTIINEFSVEDYTPTTTPAEKLTLWYTQPATATGVENTWMEYSLPIGNGQLGGSLFGGVARDEILFNEKTVWKGSTSMYGNYLPFGSIYIDDISGNFTSERPVKNYYRDLNLKTATGTVTYEDADGVKYTRKYITSNPDKSIVTKITASEAGKLNFRITMESGKPTVNAKTTYKNGYAQFTGKLQTVSYNATMRVIAKGGYTSTGTDGITVEEADEVLVILAGCTDFIGNDVSHVNGRAPYLADDNKAIVDAVAEKGWNAVYADHVADHQKYFCRVNFELDGVANDMPTNELITAYNAASGTRNHMLEQLYYNYGRYLSIASSRGVDLPNNLQGIWNNTCTPPWASDIHANINVQMNYWPVSASNLDEMYLPFLNYIINEAAQPEWRSMAHNAVDDINKALGTSTAKRDDSWTCYTENNIFGGYSTFQTNYVIANAWYVTHLWQHYRYTLDKEYLAKAFPAMKGASLFWADRMILAADNTYECPNEYSPEHGPGSENAVAHAQQIAWECIDNTLKAATVLGGIEAGIISQEDYDLLTDRLANMDKGLATETYEAHEGWPASRNGINTGDKILREWKYSRFYASGDQGHRHMSHLMALFPFGQLTPASEFFEPAINSMKLRGDESTGWSMGWKINLWARALMGDRSHAILRKALKHSTSYGTDQSRGGIYYNLFDSHAPFQIDGNFGATSGINEMLLQSHTDVIDILPALPTEWSKGHIKGLKAVGDFTVDIQWEGNQARKVTITNNQGQPCYVKCTGLTEATVTVNGTTTTIGEEKTVNGLQCYQIASNAGDEIVIDLTNATQTNKSALETLIAETEELINDCYDYYATEVALQTTNAEGAFYISTNAQEDREGPIANLVDGSVENHFHSEYTTDMGANHYININLGSENATSSFKFKYATRKAETNFPKTIEIYGKRNGEYELIETVTNLPVGNSSETKYYESPIIDSENSYSELRFTVTANNSGNNEAGGHPYFHMAEFDLMPRTAEPANNYPNAVNVPAATAKATTAVTTAKEALTATQTVAQYESTLKALQTAYDELVAAIASGTLPVLVTTDANNPIVYKIGIGRTDYAESVLEYDLITTNMVAVKNYNGNKYQLWYFTKGSTDDRAFIHPYVGGGDVLASNSVSDGNSKVKTVAKGTEGYMQEWTIPAVDATIGIYNIKPTTGSTYFSNHGGYTNKMGFYQYSNTTDAGSKFTFTRVEPEEKIWKASLTAYNEKTPEPTIGTELGYYTYYDEAAFDAAKEDAAALFAAENTAENEYKAVYQAMRAANENKVLIAPKPGKYYRLQGKVSEKYIDASTTNGGKVSMAAKADYSEAGTIFYITEDNKLLSYQRGTFLKDTYSIGGNKENGNTITFNASESGNVGYFTLKTNYSGSKYIYDNGSNGHIDRNGAYAANNCDWKVEEVTELPVTVTSAGYATFYSPVETTIPEGVKAYYATEAKGNYVILEEIIDIIPAYTGVILENEGDYMFGINDEETTESIDDNLFGGTYYNDIITPGANEAYYVLGVANEEVGLYKALLNENDGTAFENQANKAYLCMRNGSNVKFFSFNIGGGTTSIEDINADSTAGAIYDLQGRKIESITAPGIYIIGGKATIVK